MKARTSSIPAARGGSPSARALRAGARLLVLLMVPVVVIAGPGQRAAQAVTTVGPVKSMTYGIGGVGAWTTAGTCGMSFYWSRASTSLATVNVVTGFCKGGWLNSPENGGVVNESDRWTVATFNGTGCPALGTGFMHSPDSGQMTWSGSASATLAGPGDPWATCVVTEVCWRTHLGVNVFPDQESIDCKALDLGAPPAANDAPVLPDTCTHILPKGALLDMSKGVYPGTTPNGTYWWARLRLAAGSVIKDNTADLRTILVDKNGETITLGRSPSGFMNPVTSTPVADQQILHQWNWSLSNSWHPLFDPAWFDHVVGVQFYYADRAGNPPGTGTYGKVATAVASTGGSGMVGLTDPSKCWFYFGEKVADISGDTDVPAGPVGGITDNTTIPTPPAEPTVPDDMGCGFSLGNPSTWLEGGMCAAVGMLGGIFNVLGRILQAVLGIAGQIIAALAGILEDMFVPDPDSWDFDGLKDALEDKPPMSVVSSLGSGLSATFASFDSATSADCDSLFDGFTSDFGDDAKGQCNDGVVANLKTLMGIGLVVTTGLLLWAMFASVFKD